MLHIATAATPAERQACYGIRIAVFVEEQGIPFEEELDEHDEGAAVHYVAREDDRAVGTARIVPAGERAKLGRIAVLSDARGKGYGDALVRRMMDDARAEGYREAVLDAQHDKLGFYERFGFRAHGPEFDDGSGIMHRRMTAALTED